ncbi:NusA-like transcription termination signal-binding factor [Candidatus Woesearchaeota archaeon CG_4_10_14_0_2_um_filter_33_10]|nr:MAG: NusA-like transcription termination signal-binding factor [Candidatus Woesearchaeota archaeon CG10_big_fil_rev_8_21_14_0_10_33_12]PIU72387.1 MAG: NusA-like transcription termination signal-binding factor [Candidatus Woesearchaeota archaeon CG06_land_8_20_14_3_00_33_13]PIZ54104.1 MAG: NusA-like transcription termination signal-binding factor [Candidatus Woesearchaeota archaeon CG_4_10_14_0_2_um_filter_33_10]
MMKIKYDLVLMKFMSFFESLTNTRLKDCFVDKNGLLVFVVEENQIAKAIGKKGVNVRNIKEKLNRKIKIVEFNPHLETFVANIIRPLIGKEIKVDDDVVTIVGPDTKTKGLLIGRNGQNLRNYEETVKRYFDIKEIKVI